MNPLMIASGVGKLINTCLIDKDRLCGTQLTANKIKQVFGAVGEKCGHKRFLIFYEFITAADIAGACLWCFSPFALR